MRKNLTNEIIDERIKGRNILRLENVVNAKTKIKWKCLIDGYEWLSTPDHILRTRFGCHKCAKQIRMTNEIIDEKIKGRTIQRIENVVNALTKIKWKCLIDGHEWEASPYNMLKAKNGCPKCTNNLKLTNEMIDEKIKGRNIVRIDNVIDAITKIKWKCLNDGHIWEAQPKNILNANTGCPKCKTSKGELKIEKILIENNIDFIKEKRFDNCKNEKPLPFDFYIPKLNIIIEYDGVQHFQPFKNFGGFEKYLQTINNDKIKNDWAKTNNIKLIRIPYFMKLEEIKNILNKEIFLKSI